MKTKNVIAFIVTFTILVLAVLGSLYYKNLLNMQQGSIHYTDILMLKKQYPHNKNSFTQGLFFYNNQMYESVRIIWKIIII